MKRIILFSKFTKKNRNQLCKLLFPKSLRDEVFAYLPCDGKNEPSKYRKMWREKCASHNTRFVFIDNTSPNASREASKLMRTNILLLPGGNTFQMLYNLKKSGLDKIIKKIAKQENHIIAGFSAGALVLTPTIKVCLEDKYDKNEINLQDLSGINVVDFEVLPHYLPEKDKQILKNYQNKTNNMVKPITDDEYILIEN